MDDVLKNAQLKRDAALAEARRWDDFIRMYSELQGSVRNIGEQRRMPGMTALANSGNANEPPKVPKTGSSGGTMQETEARALEIISGLGRPVPTRELLDELRKRGLEIGGKDPASTLSARLSRAPKLENVRPHGWRERIKADGDVFG